ncbi:MAG: R3H domain-containing nucleic acid-binding protein [Fimbriimonadaceae bacterium]
MLNSVFEAGDLDASVSCSELNGRYVNLEISGQDVGFLVGRRGEVLNAIQYYMNVVAARKLHNGVRVTLEGDNYREKRATSLSNMAQEIAAEVVKRGQEAVLDPLPAFERRIIHQALSEIEGISTYSEGEEPNRRIVIAPGEGAKNSDD